MKKAIIIYESQTGATEAMAKIIETELKKVSIDVLTKRITKAKEENFDLIRAINTVDAVIIGSPTHYSRILPTAQEFMTELERANYMSRVNFTSKLGVAFGSYGWSGSGEGVKYITGILKDKLKMKVIDPGLLIKGKPDTVTSEECRVFSKILAEKIQDFPKI